MTVPRYERSVDRPPACSVGVPLPEDVASVLGQGQDERAAELRRNQAFPLITIDPSGHPHVLMISQRQLALNRCRQELLVSVHGQQTRSNLKREGRATLLAVTANAAHYLRCTVVRHLQHADREGFELRIVEHESDSAGVTLSPMTFEFSPELAAAERWDLDQGVVEALRSSAQQG